MSYYDQPSTICPRCSTEIFWSFTEPRRMTEDDDERDWFCGPCQEFTHWANELHYWREQGLESLREHRDWMREQIARKHRQLAA